MQTIREHKTTLLKILSGDARIVLQYVDQARIITLREYNNLKDDLTSHHREDVIINLLDKVMHKGDNHCHRFLKLLEQDEMQETFPQLNELLIPPAVKQAQETSETQTVSHYKMSSIPRGVCVIINNTHFDINVMLHSRKGTEVDVGCLNDVFQWLGFTVELHTNKTAEEMKELLTGLSQREHKGDCFICCILSYSENMGFYGTDGGIIGSSDIFDGFSRANCPSLADKPKVFILHNGWKSTFAIPDSDFLVALATIPGLNSYRHIREGSWFIQSLCRMLKEGCQRGEDIFTIFTRVTAEVSAFNTQHSVPFQQIPHIDFTLRKRLVFHVPDPDHPGS